MPNGKKVLIIEDDKFLNLVLKSKLERDGFLVSQAFDGEEGLAKARSENPDIVLLDLILPKMSGFEFMGVVRTDPQLSKIPVLVASNLGQESDIEKAKSLGVQDYYVKAVTPVDEIASKVKKAVGLPEYAEEAPAAASTPAGDLNQAAQQPEPVAASVDAPISPEQVQPEISAEPVQEAQPASPGAGQDEPQIPPENSQIDPNQTQQ